MSPYRATFRRVMYWWPCMVSMSAPKTSRLFSSHHRRVPVSRSTARLLLSACLAALLAAPFAGGHAAAQSDAETEAPAANQPDAAEAAGDPAEEAGNEDAAEPDATSLTEREKAASDGTDAAADAELPEDLSLETVIATVGETDITLGQLLVARQGLPGEFQHLPDEILMQALIEQVSNQTLLADAAREARSEERRVGTE